MKTNDAIEVKDVGGLFFVRLGTKSTLLTADELEALRDAASCALAAKSPVTNKPSTVTVRIAVVVDHDGQWGAAGWGKAGESAEQRAERDRDGMECAISEDVQVGANRFYVTAELPIPRDPEVVEVAAETIEEAK